MFPRLKLLDVSFKMNPIPLEKKNENVRQLADATRSVDLS